MYTFFVFFHFSPHQLLTHFNSCTFFLTLLFSHIFFPREKEFFFTFVSSSFCFNTVHNPIICVFSSLIFSFSLSLSLSDKCTTHQPYNFGLKNAENVTFQTMSQCCVYYVCCGWEMSKVSETGKERLSVRGQERRRKNYFYLCFIVSSSVKEEERQVHYPLSSLVFSLSSSRVQLAV